jgi:phosphopantetheinyl transferase
MRRREELKHIVANIHLLICPQEASGLQIDLSYMEGGKPCLPAAAARAVGELVDLNFSAERVAVDAQGPCGA